MSATRYVCGTDRLKIDTLAPRSSALSLAYHRFYADHPDWDRNMPGGSDWIAPDSHYYTSATEDGREDIDYRPAVHEPAVGSTGLPLLPAEIAEIAAKAETAEKAAQKGGKTLTPNGGISYVSYTSIAPQAIPDPSCMDEWAEEKLEIDAGRGRAEDIAVVLRELFDGQARHRDVLERLLWGWSIAEIAEDTRYSERHVRNIIRGNRLRPGAEHLGAWLSRTRCEAPTKMEPLRTKKNLRFQAVVAQIGWDFDAMLGVQA